MSTEMTKNYGLHAWRPEDSFLRAEINENFAALDEKAVRMVFGSYTGELPEYGGTVRNIQLGARPRVVIVTTSEGFSYGTGRYFSAMAGPGLPAETALILGEEGFSVCNEKGGSILLNISGHTYHYLALL